LSDGIVAATSLLANLELRSVKGLTLLLDNKTEHSPSQQEEQKELKKSTSYDNKPTSLYVSTILPDPENKPEQHEHPE
jgi:hypothetical protein